MKSWKTPLSTAAAVLALAGCQADQEALDSGAGMETPPAVEQAPAAPIPPQPLPQQRTGPADTTLPPLDIDTMTAENI